MSVHGIRKQARAIPIRGTARELLLTLRRSQAFFGPVARLAELSGAGENAVWRALERLDYWKLVTAREAGPGAVSVRLTSRGRRVDLTDRSRR